jgi:hypothetical protein
VNWGSSVVIWDFEVGEWERDQRRIKVRNKFPEERHKMPVCNRKLKG